MELFLSFLGAFVATVGYGVFFNISKKILVWVGVTGAVGWIMSVIMIDKQAGAAWAYMVSALAVAFLGEFFAIRTKNPSTLFSIPGIYPLVPGYGLYTTMYHFTRNDINLGMTAMIDTLTKAGAIAVGIIIMSSLGGIRKKILSNKNKQNQNGGDSLLEKEDIMYNMFE